MVIRKIGIVNVKLVKGNFATRKHYHLKLSTRKKQLATRKIKFLNFQLIKHNLQLINLQFVKSNSQLVKSNSQLTKSNSQLVILFPTCKINLQLVKLL